MKQLSAVVHPCQFENSFAR